MVIGYARVSAGEQNLDLQTAALKQAGYEEIYTDERSGIKSERPGLQKALTFVRSGDTLVVRRLDRLGHGGRTPSDQRYTEMQVADAGRLWIRPHKEPIGSGGHSGELGGPTPMRPATGWPPKDQPTRI